MVTKNSDPMGLFQNKDPRHRTILLVDDDSVNLQYLAETLQAWGYRVVTSEDARSALSKAGSGVDVIITDYRMPGMNGLEFMEALRRKMPATPVIMLTAHTGVESYLKAFSLGAFEYVNKPVRNAELKRILNAALSAARA